MSTRLMLVDGLAVAYRAFYGVQQLSTRAGKPTNAVFGFIRMVQQLDERWHPTHGGVIFDGGLPQERMAELPTYKAQRPPMPDALKGQLQDIQAYLGAAGWTWLRQEGLEADDVMATLAVQARTDGVDEILIASGDKDFFQLVDDRIGVVPVAGADAARMDEEQVLKRCGVPPAAIVDWLALTGDTADNIPGVPGVGPKTAAKLITEYGSIEGLWGGLEHVPNQKLREALGASREIVERNRRMVALRTDCPVPIAWRGCARKAMDREALRRLYEALELRSFLRQLDADGQKESQGMLF